MNSSILNTEIQEFISTNLNSDITSLILKGTSFSSVETKEVIEQIEQKTKCQNKLPTWFNTKNIYYPNKLNIEQTSSETTAKYKANLISGNSIIDLTGGFGVDCYCFSKHFENVTHCEINENLSQIVKHNYSQFKLNNINCITTNGIEYLKSSNNDFDWIYIDPSRRHESKGKVFFLKDCLPNVPENLDTLFKYSKNVLIKTSPLLDISIGINELQNVQSINIVAVNNEVKELLWTLENGFNDEVSIKTINLKKNKEEIFNFKINEEAQVNASFSEPLTYLYEPNSAILKSGAFKTISEIFKVNKLHVNTHLYTSNTLINFPGRVFKIEKTFPYNKKLLKKELLNKVNISTRNFPETVKQLKKKYNFNDGGNSYIFFTTNYKNEKIVLVCSKVN